MSEGAEPDDEPEGVRTPRLRKTGHRRTLVWLAPVLTAAVATQTRAITTRRFVYLIIDPPTEDLAELVKHTNAKARLRLVPDESGNIPAGAKGWAEERISDTLSDMREQGFMDPRRLLDNRSEEVGQAAYADADAWLAEKRAEAERFRLRRQEGQPRRYECWTEAADTMADLSAALEPFGVWAYSSSGQTTVGALDRLGRRIVADTRAHRVEGERGRYVMRQVIVLYVGDYDPPGVAMPKEIEKAAVWAHRWWKEREFWFQGGLTGAEAWAKACDEVGDDPGPFSVKVIRVAVTQDDLATHAGTSTVSPTVAEQYKRWWPEGETRTLQVEGIPVADVVARVTSNLSELFDADALNAAYEREAEAHSQALAVLAVPDDDEPEDDEPDDDEPDDDEWPDDEWPDDEPEDE